MNTMMRSCRFESVQCHSSTRRSEQKHASVARTHSTINVDRRSALLSSVATLTFINPPYTKIALANEQDSSTTSQQDVIPSPLQFDHISEPILAYDFDYPTTTSSGNKINLVFSRQPERYSSAAPLTADARQRIVLELVDLINAVTISVSVGPPAGTLKTTPQSAWTPRQVAEQVLIDRSTARVTSGQRVSLNTVESATSAEKLGSPYYIYEHISQGSPTLMSQSRETYRHALAVTAIRPGLEGSPFLYTLNVACPQQKWSELEEPFRKCVESFVLVDPGREYVAPDQDPWRFF